jgi:transcriptional regulator with XRE-family HTH domain
MNDPKSFGAALRRERERRGITLETISERTKVSVSLLGALERGDLSRWPGGIFRRAFVRGYAEVVGLDADSVTETFARVCPEQSPPEPAGRLIAASFELEEPLRLTLATDEARLFDVLTRRRLMAAGIDLGAVLAPAAIFGVAFGLSVAWGALAILGVTYHLLGVLLAGTTPGTWIVSRPQPAPPETPDAQSSAEPSDGESGTRETTDEARRPAADLLFTPRRRDRRQVGRIERYPRRPSDSRVARR